MIILQNNNNKKNISENDFYDYLKYNILGDMDENVDKTTVLALISWLFQITVIYVGFTAKNSYLEVSCGDKSVTLYNTGIEKNLINHFNLND